MRARLLSMLVLAALLAVPVATAEARKDVRLRQFKTCPSLIRYGLKHVKKVTRQGWAGPPAGVRPMQPQVAGGGSGDGATGAPAPAAAPEAGRDFSTTNNQEGGVDEPDIVKTDGRTVFAVAGGSLHAIDVSGAEPRLAGSLGLGGYDAQLLIDGDRALITWTKFAQTAMPSQQPDIAPQPYPYSQPRTVLAEVDIADPSSMRILRTLTVDGTLLSSRMTGSTARVVLSTTPRALVEPARASGSAVARTARVRRTRAAAWLPAGTLRNVRRHTKRKRALSHCRATRRPKAFGGLGMLTVLTIDLSKGLEPVDSDSVMSSGDIVYASEKALYVATQRWAPAIWRSDDQDVADTMTTEVHKFDISDPEATLYRGSGQVPGFLLSQFAMSEHAGVLRVASTVVPPWFNSAPPVSESFVTTLDERAGKLVPLGAVGGLGKGERIYAVRFIGDTGYVVTFRQVDPLYTVDVSDPAAPRVAGELKVLGYSAYLHPAGKDLLIGIGQDASEEGMRSGAQISLFDVSDPAAPARLQHYSIGAGSSTAEYDHHAFLWWPATNLAVLPLTLYTPPPSDSQGRPTSCCGDSFTGAIGFGVTRDAIAEAGRVQHTASGGYQAQISRSLVVDGRLYTLSDAGLKASRLDTLAETGWAPFPAG